MQNLLAEDKEKEVESQDIPFDNRYDWLKASFQKLNNNLPVTVRRPNFVWGVLQGAALGKVLGLERISVIEFGVAGGAGLIALEHTAERVEEMLQIGIDVYGFDTGCGLPKPQDYRDSPNIWMGEGQFPMDKEQLAKRLRRASLQLGLVKTTVPAFLSSAPAPVAFVSIDLDLYSSTRDALRLFTAEHDRLLPRVLCYFDDLMGLTYSDYNGERLAIAEFNTLHAMRKISPLYGLKYFVPPAYINNQWPELFYFLHIFDHPLYNEPDEVRKPLIMDVEGKVREYRPMTIRGRTRKIN